MGEKDKRGYESAEDGNADRREPKAVPAAAREGVAAREEAATREGFTTLEEAAEGEGVALDGDSTAEDAAETDAGAQAVKSSNIVSVLVIISRITGFFRTSAQAWALGAFGIASAYTVANNLPNLLYEFVAGGMLITAFLPVYLSVKKRAGREGASEYASNLLSLVLILMAVVTVLSFVFAVPIVWTQSAGASKGFDAGLAVWFFRWFSCEIVLYALSSIISGVLNAERDYFASNAAPIANNFIVIASFVIYALLTRNPAVDWRQAAVVLAIGNPLGVVVQVLMQVPALRRHGVRLHARVDIHDPALKETLSIGLPTLVVTIISTPTAAVTSSMALSVTPAGASIAYYARVWYVLPYSIFAIPISVTLFTELSSSFIKGDIGEFKEYLCTGTRRIFFTLIPLTMFLMVFAPCLIAVLSSGNFTPEAAAETSMYLQALALSLPFYGLMSFVQKVCSSMMRMKFYMIATCMATVLQIAICVILTPRFGLYVVPISSTFFYGTIDLVVFARIRSELGNIGMRSVVVSSLRALALGVAGSLVGWGILMLLTRHLGPCVGAMRGLLYAAAGGIPAVLVTFGGAVLLRVSDAPFFDALFAKVLPRRLGSK